ncbi:uncharacterized protein BJ171DRAFT_517233 [Polychytrium aggregatum]|uniref:uncharacterized protein n=1 Tax=Polychytrium aggregatum TaxID=110093 RepID=UPI0022FE4EA3|nr:uncharacterized protein BJ171DRAFT_517233 [Polychytrium aggregatum]KAI9199873.1 hypothetical protein BJ171DRAFT_517233 [Polychytrium aggregatum]
MLPIRYTAQRGARSFYSWNIPTNTPRVALDDGSLLIHRKAPTPTPVQVFRSESQLPPLARPNKVERPHRALTPAEVREAQTLRHNDPDSWCVEYLAERYNTSAEEIMEKVKAPKIRKEFLVEREVEQFERLGISKKKAIIERIRRKSLW